MFWQSGDNYVVDGLTGVRLSEVDCTCRLEACVQISLLRSK